MSSHSFIQNVLKLITIIFWFSVFGLFLYLPHLNRIFPIKKSLSIFTWSAGLNPKYITKFEKETGIKLYISYYDTNEELMSKIETTKGQGYDLIVPSDYIIESLIKQKFLKKIDKSKIKSYHNFNPRLMNKYYDPNNNYSLPYYWETYGLGINTTYYKEKNLPITWGLVFDKQIMPPHIGMTDAPREAIYIASQYLFGSIDAVKNPKNLEKVKDLLIAQKSHVEAYSEVRVEEMLLAESVPVALGQSNDISRVTKENPAILFKIPQDGTFYTIDSLAIPQSSKKEDLIYEFINFLYREDVYRYHLNKYHLCSTLKTIQPDTAENFCPTDEIFNNIQLFRNVVPITKLNDIWLAVMAE